MSKYHNIRTKAHGFTFDSGGEAARYGELLLLQRGGQIHDLHRQVPIQLRGVNGTVVCTYKADFVYHEKGQKIVEDFKGAKTALFQLKAKLFRDNYGHDILLTGKRR